MSDIGRRKEHKKEGIRRAAQELFEEFGFGKVSLNEIARRAGQFRLGLQNILFHQYISTLSTIPRGSLQQLPRFSISRLI